MPKDKTGRASASHKTKAYAYKPYSRHGKEPVVAHGDATEGEDSTVSQDWEDATCPICMDAPHNAVLLVCSSHDKGCRPYMCDTSYRHSNCLDQYRKAHATVGKVSARSPSFEPFDVRIIPRPDGIESSNLTRMTQTGRSSSGGSVSEHEPIIMDEGVLQDAGGREGLELTVDRAERVMLEKKDTQNLMCPLCRGKVQGWAVVEAARHFLNQKARTCAQESCSFSGAYEELRAHARCEHPLARPSEVDPARQRDWRRLERQRDLGDVLSTIRSAMPGATVFGDYVIEDDHENDDTDFPGDGGHWWTVFLLFQVFGPAASIAGGRVIPSRLRGAPRGPHRSLSSRQVLWGENAQRIGNSEGNSSSASSDTGDHLLGPARRRRRSHHRSHVNPS